MKVRVWKRPAFSGPCVDCGKLCTEERVICRTDVEPHDRTGSNFGTWIRIHEDCMAARCENAMLEVAQ